VCRPINPDTNWILIHSNLLIINNILEEYPELLVDANFVDYTVNAVLSGINHEKVMLISLIIQSSICHSSVQIISKLLLDNRFQSFGTNMLFFDNILKIITDTDKSSDTRRDSIVTIKKIAKFNHDVNLILLTLRF
jgi:hypothetical protein